MTKPQRSRAMSAVRGSNTQIEKTLRSALHHRGFRFRKNVRSLPGRPDIVLAKHNCVIFVHGCFWHQHKGCKRSKLPTTRRAFWTKKLTDNIQRDQRQANELRSDGWRVITVWECQLKQVTRLDEFLEKLESRIDELRL